MVKSWAAIGCTKIYIDILKRIYYRLSKYLKFVVLGPVVRIHLIKTDIFCRESREIKTDVQGIFIWWFLRDYWAYNYDFNIFKKNISQTFKIYKKILS